MSCLDLVLLWLWHRSAASALIQPLARELPYAVGVALKKKKKRLCRMEDQGYCGVHMRARVPSRLSDPPSRQAPPVLG